ncbi:MAG: hypothetical protein K6G84_16085 [Lachnospiraceae bacterium]|nr:hypothetical protein [Lachnospiraceae bacterium]
MSNSDNPRNGAAFQTMVRDWFNKKYEIYFEEEKKIPIGNPAKDHKFDIVDETSSIVIECKRYTWTTSGNVPSAKMGFTNEAAFYLSFLPDYFDKYIVMLESRHAKRKESLAEYYYRINKHLLGKINVAEYDPESGRMNIIGQADSTKYYFIKDLQLFAKGMGTYANYIYKDGIWSRDKDNFVSDRVMGYDPYEDDDSPYKIGNTSIMNEIEIIAREEFYRKICKKI